MAHHGAAGWSMGSAGSGMDGGSINGNDINFLGQVDHSAGSYLEGPASHDNHYEHMGYVPSISPYDQQAHGQYAPQHQYSSMSFGVEGQPAYAHDVASLGPTQVAGQSRSNEYQQPNGSYPNGQNLNFRQFQTQDLVGHYPGYTQQQQQQQQPQQQHVGANDFQRNSWVEPQLQHTPSHPYAQGQQLYGNNTPLLRMAAASPAQSSTPNPEKTQPLYRAEPASSLQPHVHGGNFQASHPVSWPPQVQAQRLGNVSIASAATRSTPPSVPRPPTTDLSRAGFKLGPPTTNTTNTTLNDAVVFVRRIGTPGEGWKPVKGCPNLFEGVMPVRRQVVTNTPGVKPHVAGDNRNGTRLLPLLPDPLPCEKLREEVRPLVEELKRVGESIDRAKQQIKAVPDGSEEHKRHTNDLRKLESRKMTLESEKKKITGKAGVVKVGKNRATGKSEATEYDSESLTESSGEEDPQELIVQQIMASQTRPTEPDKGVEYDVVRIIRRELNVDQGVSSQAEKEDPWSKVIGQRVADFGKYVVDICAEAKALREQKSSAPNKSQASQLQIAIDQKYDLVRVALDTALEFGDEETLRNMGQHMKLMSGLTIALSRQFANKTYNTDIPRTILRFISEATLMDLDVFQKVKLSTVLEKHGDNLDDEGKQLVAEITKNAEERTAKNAVDKPAVSSQPKQKPLDNVKDSQTPSTQKNTTSTTKNSNTTSKTQAISGTTVPETARKETKAYSGLISARKVANGAGKAAAGVSPTKRPRDDDADSRATKKLAIESATGSGRIPSTSISNSVTPPNSSTPNGQARPRLSGSTVLNKSRAAPKAPIKKPEPQSSSVSSTISGLLAEIAKPAEKPKPPERPVKAPETPEERERRLRKEKRRGRTVTWKSDEELVQIRYFEHDSTEDEGRASNMIRDARDNRLEGQMLKQMQRSMQEGDDEEDDGNPTETDIRPWVPPRPFDPSYLDASRREKNYVTCGGSREIESEQKKIMEEYENRELMTIYTTLSEIPDTPRSPPRKNLEPIIQPRQGSLSAHDPNSREHLLRWQEVKSFGTNAACQAALQRLGFTPKSAYLNPESNTTSRMMTQEERDTRVLALLNSDRARNYVDPNPCDPTKRIDPPESRDQKVQEAFSIIYNIVEQYKNAPTRTSQPAPNRAQDGYAGYSHGVAESAQNQYGISQMGQYAGYQTQPQAQQHQQSYSQLTPQVPASYQTQPQLQQHQQGYSQVGSQVPDSYAAILQQVQALQNPQATQSAVVPQPTPAQPDNNVAALLTTLGLSTQQNTQQNTQQAPTSTQDSTYAAWLAWAQSQAQTYGAQSQAHSQSQSYPSYSQQYDTGENTYGKQEYQSQNDQQYNRDSSDRGNRKDFVHRVSKDHKGINRALIGTKPCTFWAKGQCAKGDNCTFRHDTADLK
ncbi:hypothetical protein F5Y09DRAFT_249707 [Xylaria sp. FL1042]|nr:hypothetical protein F5Y09DRAFT_249707 [Xylaria sp. FL1042]